MSALAENRSDNQAKRVAKILGLKVEVVSQVQLARSIEKGLPAGSIKHLAEIFGRREIVGPVIPEATLRRSRKDQKPLSRSHSERVYELSVVADAVYSAFDYDEGRARAFMTRPHPLLDGATPLELSRSSAAGADAVLQLIKQAEAGVAL